MRALTKAQKQEHADLCGKLVDVEAAIDAAYDEYNATMKAAHEKLTAVLSDAEPLFEEIHAFRDGVIEMMQEYQDDRAEDWAESPGGEVFAEWQSAWEQIDLSIDGIEDLDELVSSGIESADDFKDLDLDKPGVG